MPYEQKNNPFRKLVSDIGSALGKLNIKSPDGSSPTSQQAYQQAQRKRFGHQKESKFQYDVRMRKNESRAKRTMHDPDKDKIPTGVDATPWGDIPGEQQTVSTNPNDLRPTGESYVPQEFRGGPGDKFRYRKVGEREEGGRTYAKYEFMDPDRPKLGWITAQGVMTKKGIDFAGFNRIQELFWKRRKQGKLFDSPVE